MDALAGEKIACNGHVLGGDLEPSTLAHGCGVVKAITHGHADAAFGDLQIQRLVQALAARFKQRVFAHHTEVSAAVLHIGRHVGGAHQDHAQVGLVGVQNQFA